MAACDGGFGQGRQRLPNSPAHRDKDAGSGRLRNARLRFERPAVPASGELLHPAQVSSLPREPSFGTGWIPAAPTPRIRVKDRVAAGPRLLECYARVTRMTLRLLLQLGRDF